MRLLLYLEIPPSSCAQQIMYTINIAFRQRCVSAFACEYRKRTDAVGNGATMRNETFRNVFCEHCVGFYTPSRQQTCIQPPRASFVDGVALYISHRVGVEECGGVDSDRQQCSRLAG